MTGQSAVIVLGLVVSFAAEGMSSLAYGIPEVPEPSTRLSTEAEVTTQNKLNESSLEWLHVLRPPISRYLSTDSLKNPV